METLCPLTGALSFCVIYIHFMDYMCGDNGNGNYGVPDGEYVSLLGDLEHHYTWFETPGDALEYAQSIDNGPTPFKWSAFDGIVTLGV